MTVTQRKRVARAKIIIGECALEFLRRHPEHITEMFTFVSSSSKMTHIEDSQWFTQPVIAKLSRYTLPEVSAIAPKAPSRSK